MRSGIAILAALLLLTQGRPAFAASLPSLREQAVAAEGRARTVSAERARLQAQLDDVARRIEARKAGAGGEAVLRDGELDALLKQSQELSAKLNALTRDESESSEALSSARARLVGELDQQIGGLRSQWDAAADRKAREAVVGQLKSLRSEREALRRELPAALVPHVSEKPSDDPDELRERADALLDGEDKLRREQKAIADRIRELRNERDLERRMSEYVDEESLFDEHDRRLTVSRPNAFAAAASDSAGPATKTSTAPSAPPSQVGSATDKTAPESTMSPSGTPPGDQGFAGGPRGSSTSNALPAPEPGRQSGLEPVRDAAPRSGTLAMPPERRAGVNAFSDDESVEDLESREAQIRKLADDLHRKAEETAKKAKTLEGR